MSDHVTVMVERAGVKLDSIDPGSEILHFRAGTVMELNIIGSVHPFAAHRRIHGHLFRKARIGFEKGEPGKFPVRPQQAVWVAKRGRVAGVALLVRDRERLSFAVRSRVKQRSVQKP